MVVPEEKPSKKEKKEFKHFHLTEFYKLRKIKYSLDLDVPNSKLSKAQFIYTFELRPKEEVVPIIEATMQEGHKKAYVDLGIHLKQMLVKEIWEIEKVDGKYQRTNKVKIPDE